MAADWVDQHTSRAPAALRSRIEHYALHAAGPSLPQSLAAAGQAALNQALSQPGDRSAALDLLAADALITLALLAQAQSAPEWLEEFAGSILQASRSDA